MAITVNENQIDPLCSLLEDFKSRNVVEIEIDQSDGPILQHAIVLIEHGGEVEHGCRIIASGESTTWVVTHGGTTSRLVEEGT